MSSLVASGPLAVRRQPRPSASARSALRLLAIVAASLAATALVLRVLVGPLAAVRHIVVSGDSPLPEQEILRVAGLAGGESLVSLDPALIASRLEAVSTIRTVRVEKLFPGTVRITLERREPVALVLAEDAGRLRAALVDSDGVVFAAATGGAALDLPVVSGPAVKVGDRLPRAATAILADLATLGRRSPSLLRLVSEVSIEPATDGAATGPLDFLLYLASAPVPVRARGSLDARLVQYALLAVDLLSSQGKLGDIRELDLRGGEVVCRLKEG